MVPFTHQLCTYQCLRDKFTRYIMESSVAWEIAISENKDLDNIFVLFLILGLLSVMNHFVYDKY
jgi:hypothetical protein